MPTARRVGYLGPEGSWTHQAALDLFDGAHTLVPLSSGALFQAFRQRRIDLICVPVHTTVIGATPYREAALALRDAVVVAEHERELDYSLMAQPGSSLPEVHTVFAHPVAFEETRPWLDRELPHAQRRPTESGGAAARAVAQSTDPGLACMGAPLAARLHGLVALASGIEHGPHNVTRWWVMGHADTPTE